MATIETLVTCPRCRVQQPESEFVSEATCRLCWHLARAVKKGKGGRDVRGIDPHTAEGFAMLEEA